MLENLKKIIKGEVFQDEETLQKYSRDASLFEVKPKAVVTPKDAEDLKALVRWVSSEQKNGNNIFLTPRSGGTDMTGGPLGESIILDFTKHFNQIKKIGLDYAIVEPGVFYRDFEAETLKKGLFLPSYPASRGICTVGGMVANNAGGEKTLAYGKTEKYVYKLKIILADGEEHEFQPLTKEELSEKLSEPGYAGDLYRKMHDLVMSNRDVLEQARPKVSKNSAGYYLWNVWDGQYFDLTKILVGSQGTLGIITEITFRLVRPMKHSVLGVIFLKDLSTIVTVAKKLLEYHPESLESYDDRTFKLALKFLPDIIKALPVKHLLTLPFRFLPELGLVLSGGFPKLVILAEFAGNDKDEVNLRAEQAMLSIQNLNLKARLVSQGEAEKYWTIRHESFNLLRKHVSGRRTAPFIDDFAVSVEKLADFFPELNNILGKYDLLYTIAGHVGDGNFHIIPLVKIGDPSLPATVRNLSEEVYNLVLKYGGSFTAEHNDGLIRSPYLRKMYGDKVFGLFEETKNIFDPLNIFNPGKKTGASLDYAIGHLSKS